MLIDININIIILTARFLRYATNALGYEIRVKTSDNTFLFLFDTVRTAVRNILIL